jgi:sugar lactone lactonase YvrE
VGFEKHFWEFDDHVSAAGWIDRNGLLIASEPRLFSFNLAKEAQKSAGALGADNRHTRSNDGRTDP